MVGLGRALRHARGGYAVAPAPNVRALPRRRDAGPRAHRASHRVVRGAIGGGALAARRCRFARRSPGVAIADERAALLQQKLERSAPLSDIVRRRGWRFVKWRPLRGFLANGAAGLDGLEAVLGLEPAVEQRGHQLVFKW